METAPEQELSFELTAEQRLILEEYQNAQDLSNMVRSRGWEIYKKFMDLRLRQLEDAHLSRENLTPEALWADHIRLKGIREFYGNLEHTLGVKMEVLKDPESVEIALSQAGKPLDPADFEGDIL